MDKLVFINERDEAMDKLVYEISTNRAYSWFAVWAKYLNSPHWALMRVFETKQEARRYVYESLQQWRQQERLYRDKATV